MSVGICTDVRIKEDFPSSKKGLVRGRNKVLIADDVAVVRLRLRQTLINYGVDNIIEACDNVDAIKMWEENKEEIGVVFFDNNMDVRDSPLNDSDIENKKGVELIEFISEQSFQLLLVILHSADIDVGDGELVRRVDDAGGILVSKDIDGRFFGLLIGG